MPYAWYPTKPIKTNRELLFRKVCRLLDANLSFYKFQPLGSWPDKFDLQSIKTTLPKSILYKCFCLVVALGIFSKGVIKKHKLNKILIYKKKNIYIYIYTHTHTQNTKIHEILQFPFTSFHTLKSPLDSLLLVFIIYCQCKYDHFILLSLYIIFDFMKLWLYICHFFYKNILN